MKTFRPLSIFTIFLFLGLFNIASAQIADISGLKKSLEEVLEQTGIPGISLSVLKKNKQITIAVGKADLEKGTALDTDHRMLSGSIGKTYFAAVILKMAEEGKIDLNQKAAHYLQGEEWFESVQNAKDIRVLSLLNHTSGVPEYVYAPKLWETVKTQPNKEWTAGERLALIAGQKAHFPTGEGWSYADANYIILGAIVERITGQKIYELVQEQILSPLKLDQTEPSVKRDLDKITAAYSGRQFGDTFGEKISEINKYGLNPSFEWTGGGFISTSSDLAKWAHALHTGEVLSSKYTKMHAAPVSTNNGKAGTATGYGLGAQIFATSYGIAQGHTGFMPGFLSLMAYMPDYDMAIALQVNMDPYSKRMKQRVSVYDLLEKALPYVLKKSKAYSQKTTIYFVRHAEKADDGTRDPDLSASGKGRATNLAKVLTDKKIDAIYSTPFKRTRQTAQPIADALQLDIQTYRPTSAVNIFDIIANNQGKNILVVGHSNTVPGMINFLDKKAKLKQLGESEYGDLWEIVYTSGKGKTQRSEF